MTSQKWLVIFCCLNFKDSYINPIKESKKSQEILLLSLYNDEKITVRNKSIRELFNH